MEGSLQRGWGAPPEHCFSPLPDCLRILNCRVQTKLSNLCEPCPGSSQPSHSVFGAGNRLQEINAPRVSEGFAHRRPRQPRETAGCAVQGPGWGSPRTRPLG